MVERVWFTPSRLGDQRIKMSLYQHIDISTCLYIDISTYRHIDISTMTVPIGLVSTSPYVPFEMESMITDPVRSLLTRWTTSLSHGKHHFYGPVTTILGQSVPISIHLFSVSFVFLSYFFRGYYMVFSTTKLQFWRLQPSWTVLKHCNIYGNDWWCVKHSEFMLRLSFGHLIFHRRITCE